jgi:hypothetical protein
MWHVRCNKFPSHKLKTAVLQVNQDNESVPLIVAAGGGGLSQSSSKDDWSQHGHGLNTSRKDTTGIEFGQGAAGRVKFSEILYNNIFQLMVYTTLGFHKVNISALQEHFLIIQKLYFKYYC